MTVQNLSNLQTVINSLKEAVWNDDTFNLEVFEDFVTITFKDSSNETDLKEQFGHLNTVNFRTERDGSFIVTFFITDCNL